MGRHPGFEELEVVGAGIESGRGHPGVTPLLPRIVDSWMSTNQEYWDVERDRGGVGVGLERKHSSGRSRSISLLLGATAWRFACLPLVGGMLFRVTGRLLRLLVLLIVASVAVEVLSTVAAELSGSTLRHFYLKHFQVNSGLTRLIVMILHMTLSNAYFA